MSSSARSNSGTAAAKSSKRLETIPGIGPITASALVASAGDPSNFKNARQFAAWIGLVPHQNSSGGKTQLLGISKRGNVYLRTLLIHGGRALVQLARTRADLGGHLARPTGRPSASQRRGRSDGQQERAAGVGVAVVRAGLRTGSTHRAPAHSKRREYRL